MRDTDKVEVTISLRADLMHSIKEYAEGEEKTPEDFIVDTLWELRKKRGTDELRHIQSYGSKHAEALGMYTEEELFRYLES